MKYFFLFISLFPLLTAAQQNKEQIIDNTIKAIHDSKAGAYDIKVTHRIETVIDTVLYSYDIGKFSYHINDNDTIMGMKFSYDIRKTHLNLDKIESQVYNGVYYFSSQDVKDNNIPDPQYRILDVKKPIIRKIIRGYQKDQLSNLYNILRKTEKDKFKLLSDTIIGKDKFHRFEFINPDDPFHKYDIYVNSESYLPVSISCFSNVNKCSELKSVSKFENFRTANQLNNDGVPNVIVNQHDVDPNYIVTTETKKKYGPMKHIPAGTVMPEIHDETIYGDQLELKPGDHKVRLILFAQANCDGNTKFMPEIKTINKAFKTHDGVEVFAFFPNDDPAFMRKYIKDWQTHLTMPVCAGKKDVVEKFGLHGYPDVVLVNDEGKIVKWYEAIPGDSTAIIKDINKLLGK